MSAQIGYDGLDLLGDPRPELLIDVARVQPGPGRDWVDLGRLGFRSTQRLWIGDVAGGVAVATWPAELKPQACYLYCGGLGSALVAAAIERGWAVEPSPHIAFRTASAGRRLYMRPSVAPLDYVACWEDEDALSRIGGNYARWAVEHELWPWLKQRGFADDGDDAVLLVFSTSFSVIGPRICARAFDSAASGLPPKRPSSAPRSLKRSAASSMPCSPLRRSPHCRPHGLTLAPPCRLWRTKDRAGSLCLNLQKFQFCTASSRNRRLLAMTMTAPFGSDPIS